MNQNISYQEVSDYYDNYSKKQLKKGIHIRHKSIMKFLKKENPSKNAKVLEIGCGIGTVTKLLARFFNKGKIVAVDISPKSIEIAKHLYANLNNIEFFVSDMQDFKHILKFDVVIMADVLEHIPIEHHENLFHIIKTHTHKDSLIGINIPHPITHSWSVENDKENLQVIDQVITLKHIINLAEENGFYLQTLKNYSLYFKFPDYLWVTLKTIPVNFKPTNKSKIRLKLQQIFGRIF